MLKGNDISQILTTYASKYENEAFMESDPSKFMHSIKIPRDQEIIAFIASSLSYGSRLQFMPKIEYILTESEGNIYNWIMNGNYSCIFNKGNNKSFYRLYSYSKFGTFLSALKDLIDRYDTLGNFINKNAHSGIEAINVICNFFREYNINPIIPKDTNSCCKRLCMFLRWMVRDNSPVDLGLWSDYIDKRSLIIPLDTHVIQQANRLGLIVSKSASMSNAQRLSNTLLEIFPDDPLKGDFALFGYGVNSK